MTLQTKIDSNVTGLRFAEEQSLKVLPVTPDWFPLEPNSYADFGGEISTVARNPINPTRQRKKGVTTDLEASGGFNTDLTQTNLQKLLQGFFFADLRTKAELAVATVDTGDTTDDYEPASGGTGYFAGDLLFAKGFAAAGNNGLKKVTGSPTASSVPVTTSLSPATGQTGIISRVGFEFATGDAQISVPGGGTLPKLTATVKNLTQLGLIPGEWVFLGGDLTSEKFATAANNGFARVRTISATQIEFDKTQGVMVTDSGSGKTIRIFCGRILKNETGTLIKRRTYQLERTLGVPDDAFPSQVQSEYLVGSIPNELTLNLATADKISADLAFVSLDVEPRTGVQGVKTGNRPALVEADAFNTSSDVSRIKLAKVVPTDPAPTALFAFVQELTLTLNNNVNANKAVGVLGAFEASAGTFEVGGSLTAYFADVVATQAVRNNDDLTIDIHIVKANAGVTIDLPLLSLGDGRPNVEQDESITLPLTLAAATGAKLDPALDHTLLIVFWDFLPNAADL